VRNLEYKARIEDPAPYAATAKAIGADPRGELGQTDTYFRTPRGRLKLRETDGLQGELIFYQRDEQGADRASDYEVFRTIEAPALREMLGAALGVLTVVRKRRTLLVLDGARIHLDNVEGLGDFLELEVPVRDDDATASETINRLLRELGMTWTQCIRASYLDLALETKQ
jgi:predicted adenylyl cyclase CyaB